MHSVPVLSISNLSKSFGGKVGVENVSFSVARNEIVGLLGPNGAGKTTTINMILGVLEPEQGRVVIDGLDITLNRSQALARTNFAAVNTPLPGNVTVYQNLKFFGLIYGVLDLSDRIENVLKEFNLERFRNSKCGVLSSGEQTRLSLAKALLNNPSLLLLDEPTASIDPSASREIRQKIRSLISTGTSGVLWTSHNMREVEEVCDRVLFLSRGKILLEGNPRKLPHDYEKETLEELFIAVAREPLTLS